MEPKITRTIVPAGPGWFAAVLNVDNWTVELDPIIAFAIVQHIERDALRHEVMPLTLDGTVDVYDDNTTIKRPDGKFELVKDCVFDSEAEWIAFHRRERIRVVERARSLDSSKT